MRLEDLPVIGPILQAGSSDHVFDGFMLLGPLIVLVIILAGRTPMTIGLAGGYILGFMLYVGYKGTRARGG